MKAAKLFKEWGMWERLPKLIVLTLVSGGIYNEMKPL